MKVTSRTVHRHSSPVSLCSKMWWHLRLPTIHWYKVHPMSLDRHSTEIMRRGWHHPDKGESWLRKSWVVTMVVMHASLFIHFFVILKSLLFFWGAFISLCLVAATRGYFVIKRVRADQSLSLLCKTDFFHICAFKFWNLVSWTGHWFKTRLDTLLFDNFDRRHLICLWNNLGELAMEVGFVLNVVDAFNELKLHLVIYVELLVALTNLHLEVVVSLLNLADVHFLKLQNG